MLTFNFRMFGLTETKIERRYRQSHNERHLKDFTKHESFRMLLKQKEKTFKSKIPFVPLSKMADADKKSVPKKRREFLATGPLA